MARTIEQRYTGGFDDGFVMGDIVESYNVFENDMFIESYCEIRYKDGYQTVAKIYKENDNKWYFDHKGYTYNIDNLGNWYNQTECKDRDLKLEVYINKDFLITIIDPEQKAEWQDTLIRSLALGVGIY